jgi:tRNA 2-thiocytidine biosynthesis protein TtcA
MAFEDDQLFRKIKKLTGKAIGDFNLIEDGDRIAVAVSGGKDSYTLLHILEALRKRAPINFELVAVNVDAGYPGYRKQVLEDHLSEYHFAYRMESTHSYEIIEAKRRPESSYCSFCARLRRGVIYRVAKELDCNKVALGHHLDDFVETLLLNQFYAGSLKAMSPKLEADNGIHTVIRPLVYVEEQDIITFSRNHQMPIICCACPVCGQVEQQRKRMKQLVKDLAIDIPDIRRSVLRALGNVQPRHLLDKSLKSF